MLALLRSLSLRQLLTLPYVLLVLGVALVIGGLTFRSGQHAVDELSGQLLRETAARIALATKEHIAGAKGVLEAAFPVGVQPPRQWDGPELAELRERFWIATSIHRTPHNYAYYGDAQGRFFGLMRKADDSAELRLRTRGEGVRRLYAFSGIRGALAAGAPEERVFEPRQRPWYQLGLTASNNTWSPIYIDFRADELVTTFVRRIDDNAGSVAGVVATDLPLERISEFLRQLDISPNALAMVVEPDGQVVGISRGTPVQRDANGQHARMHAERSGNDLAAETFRAVRGFIGPASQGEPRTAEFRDAQGRKIQVGYTRLRDEADLDWWVLVAVPRSDFVGNIVRSAWHSLLLSLAAALVAIGIGWAVLSVVARTLHQLAQAVRMVGDGQPFPALPLERRDELGMLARSLSDMQLKLRTDALTGLHNRDAFDHFLAERLVRWHDGSQSSPFAVLFLDVNRFKAVNDRLGHAVGDAVLREVALRLATEVRGNDRVARYAGDEFVLMLDHLRHAGDAYTVRDDLEQALRLPLTSVQALDDELADIGISLGVAICPEHGADAASLLAHADADMYARKPRR